MVIIRRPAVGPSPEEYTDALSKIKEYLAFVTRDIDKKNLIRSDLNSQIEVLSKEKSSLDDLLKDKRDEFEASCKKRGEEIIADATERANKRAETIVSDARKELSTLVSGKTELENAIKELSVVHTEKSTKFREQIQKLEVDEASLKDEIAKLNFVRDELQRQIKSIKETVASFA